MSGSVKLLLVMLGLGVILALTLGASTIAPEPKGQFIARAQTLTPAPTPAQSATPSKPAVIEVVEHRTAPAQTPARSDSVATGGLSTGNAGGFGFIMGGNNCVACVKAMTGRGQNGNAGTWRSTHSTPQVGDIMIFRPGQQGAGGAGHVGVVKGIKNGKIQLAHCNWGGGQTEFFSTGLFF